MIDLKMAFFPFWHLPLRRNNKLRLQTAVRHMYLGVSGWGREFLFLTFTLSRSMLHSSIMMPIDAGVL